MTKKGKSGSIPWRLVLFAGLGYFVDLFDTFLVPILRAESLGDLGVPEALSLGVYVNIMNWQFAGQVLGAILVWGPLADTKGRKKALLLSILIYSFGNIATAFVPNTFCYAAARFISGIGLGGEFGAAITLISEMLPGKHQGRDRSIAMMVTTILGVFGVIAAGSMANSGMNWRTVFVISGIMGLLLFALRIRFQESLVFLQQQENKKVKTKDIFKHVLSWPSWLKFVACVLIGAPTFYVIGLLIPAAPEFARALGMTETPNTSTGMIYLYVGISLGGLGCGYLSKWIDSRKYSLVVFHLIIAGAIASCFFLPPKTASEFYVRCIYIGFGLGYWANLVTNAAEQFPTKVRGTVVIAVPNLVRFLLLPISTLFLALKPHIGFIDAAIVVGSICSVLGILSTLALPDGMKKDLTASH